MAARVVGSFVSSLSIGTSEEASVFGYNGRFYLTAFNCGITLRLSFVGDNNCHDRY